MRLALVFRAVTETFAKQWLSSAFDKLSSYEEFKKAFTELLWCPSRQESIRSPFIWTNMTEAQASRALTIISASQIWQAR
jgi:hypothetical protein